MKKNIIIICIVVVALLLGGGIAYYYSYQGAHFVTTEDAQVSADMLPVTPLLNGGITAWSAKVGDQVKAGDVLGTQETNTQLSAMAASLTTPEAQKTASDMLAAKAAIKSPMDGEVIQSSAVVGQLASASTSLAVVADMKNAYIRANIKEGSINDIQVGQQVSITIDAFPGQTFAGKVESIGRAAESVFSLLPGINSSGNYTKVTQLIPVKISLYGADQITLMPGMNASVKITIKE